MRKRFNDCATQWNDEYNRLSFAMSYYHGGQPAVVGAWGEVQRATTEVMGCAQRWYVAHSAAPAATEGVCKAQKDGLRKRMDDFKREVSAARQYAWQEWRPAGRSAEAGPSRGHAPVGLVK